MADTCECGNPKHVGLVHASELHRQHGENQLRRKQWRSLYDAGCDDPGSVAAAFLSDDAAASARALAAEMTPEFGQLQRMRKYGSHPVIGSVLTMPDRARVEKFESAVRAGIGLCERQAPDLLALTATALEDEGVEVRPEAPAVHLLHPMISNPRVRNRLRLAGHPTNRRQLGYGRLHRAQPGAEPEAQEAPEAQPGDQGQPARRRRSQPSAAAVRRARREARAAVQAKKRRC